jgi:hypothetical protein
VPRRRSTGATCLNYEAIRLLSALAFTGEARPQAGNPWNAPHTKARLARQFERVSGVRLRI